MGFATALELGSVLTYYEQLGGDMVEFGPLSM